MPEGQLIDPNDIHTAAATWSGFIYQGKIALYHSLYLLNSDEQALTYRLQLDSLEDFAIVREDNGEIFPVTLHQVKAMKSHLYSAYQEAFEKLEKRLTDFPCAGAYFHLSTNNENTIAQIKVLHPTIDIYNDYGGDAYCGLNEIDSKCEEQISHFLINNQLEHVNNVANCIILRNNLEALIFNQIIKIHANNHQRDGLTISEGAYYFIIPLDRFVAIMQTSPEAQLDNNYYLFITKELLNQYHCEFCNETLEELEGKGDVMSQDQKQKLGEYLKQINTLNQKSLLKFIQSLLPNREVKLNSIKDFKDCNVQGDEFKDAFLTILFELIVPSGKIGHNLGWKGTDGLKYAPTAINTGPANTKKICKRIYDNIQETDIEIPYESDKLITVDINVVSLKQELNVISEIEELQKSKNNITKWSEVGLVSLELAKKVIQ